MNGKNEASEGQACQCETCRVITPEVERVLHHMREVMNLCGEKERAPLAATIGVGAEIIEAVLADTQDGFRAAYVFAGSLSNELQAYLIREIVGGTVASLLKRSPFGGGSVSAIRVSPEALASILTKAAASGSDGDGNGPADA